MKKVLVYLLPISIILSLISCSGTIKNSEKVSTELESTDSIKNEETPKNSSNKDETTITSGDLYNSMITIHTDLKLTSVQNTDIGFKTLRVEVNVKSGTAIEELENFTNSVVKFITVQECKDKLLKEYDNLGFNMYVDNKFVSLVTSYKRENDDFKSDIVLNQNERYKEAAKYIK